MSMTKKDYELIAGTIAKMKSLVGEQLYVADLFADTLAKHDPRFDRDKFLQACGIEQ